MTWTEALHPRAVEGTFADKPQSAPEVGLAALPVQFIRSASGVTRYRAVHPNLAAAEHEVRTGEVGTPVELAEQLATARHGRIQVRYMYAGDGRDGAFDPEADDTPYARIVITVFPSVESTAPSQEWEAVTGVPAFAERRLLSRRADQLAWDLHVKSAHGPDLGTLVETVLPLVEGQPDPAVTPPQTAAEAAAMFAERGAHGLVLGWYVTHRRTGTRTSTPYISREAAVQHRPDDEHKVLAGPVYLPSGKVAIAPVS